jgi:hypothetical protein
MNRNGVFVLFTSLFALLAFADDGLPTVSQSKMDADQLAVYQVFLNSYNNRTKAQLNLSQVTSTFNLAARENDSCLRGIKFDTESRADSVVHRFDLQTPLPSFVRLVDPQEQEKVVRQNDPGDAIRQGKDVKDAVEMGFTAGLMTLSEVAFDKTHRYAAMSFSFVCGGLCGHGSTVVFEKRNGDWKQLKRRCGGWVS